MREIITADDVDTTVTAAAALYASVEDPARWQKLAADLDWTCWETVDHASDDLFAYAVQITGVPMASERYLPIEAPARREGGPNLTIVTQPSSGPDGLVANFEACGALLSSMVRTAAPTTRGYHPEGVTGPEGFAAMGVIEVLIHTYDIAKALELDWTPPDELCGRVLARLFPDVPRDLAAQDEWHRLLWASGRIALPSAPRREHWRWSNGAD